MEAEGRGYDVEGIVWAGESRLGFFRRMMRQGRREGRLGLRRGTRR